MSLLPFNVLVIDNDIGNDWFNCLDEFLKDDDCSLKKNLVDFLAPKVLEHAKENGLQESDDDDSVMLDIVRDTLREVFSHHNNDDDCRDDAVFRIDQAGWDLLSVAATGEKAIVDICPSSDAILWSSQKFRRTIDPVGAIIVRNIVREIHGISHLNTLLGLQYPGDVVSVNSFESIQACLERARINGELNRLSKQLGKDNFPFLETVYYPNRNESVIMNAWEVLKPSSEGIQCKNSNGMSNGNDIANGQHQLVLKLGTAVAGHGKLRAKDRADFEDYRMTLSMSPDYYTVEKFIPNITADVRIQYIDGHVRVFKKINAGGNWGANGGAVTYEDYKANDGGGEEHRECDDILDRFVFMGKAAAGLFGGLDIFSLDLSEHEHAKNGEKQYTILELNDSTTDLNPNHKREDMRRILVCCLKKIVIQKPDIVWQAMKPLENEMQVKKKNVVQKPDIVWQAMKPLENEMQVEKKNGRNKRRFSADLFDRTLVALSASSLSGDA